MLYEFDWYIRGMIVVFSIFSNFEMQKLEDMLLNILKERWFKIYKSVINGCLEINVIIIEDGSNDYVC